MKYALYIISVFLVFLVGCASTTETQVRAPGTETPAATVPTQETPNLDESAPQEPPKEISSEIKGLLEKGKTNLTSYSYNYQSPSITEAYQIYVKGNKIKIIPSEIINIDQGVFYNTIYLDTEKKTAEAYCLGYSNCGNNLGKVNVLDFKTAYIETPVDWLKKVTEAEKIDERQVEGRKSLYLQTNIGKITVESRYGFLYRVEEGKNTWEFSDATFNSVQDSDVIPP